MDALVNPEADLAEQQAALQQQRSEHEQRQAQLDTELAEAARLREIAAAALEAAQVSSIASCSMLSYSMSHK